MAVQAWFDVGGSLNGVDTRLDLQVYDPDLAGWVAEVFGDSSLSSSCHIDAYDETPIKPHLITGKVLGPDGLPLAGVVLWGFSGDSYQGGSGTDADGAFALPTTDGEIDIAFCTNRGGEVVLGGWYGGASGLTLQREEAMQIMVDGESVTGIEISLPADHGLGGC